MSDDSNSNLLFEAETDESVPSSQGSDSESSDDAQDVGDDSESEVPLDVFSAEAEEDNAPEDSDAEAGMRPNFFPFEAEGVNASEGSDTPGDYSGYYNATDDSNKAPVVTFHPFMQLPFELRCMVWNTYCPVLDQKTSYVIHVFVEKRWTDREAKILPEFNSAWQLAQAAVLRVHKASREMVLKQLPDSMTFTNGKTLRYDAKRALVGIDNKRFANLRWRTPRMICPPDQQDSWVPFAQHIQHMMFLDEDFEAVVAYYIRNLRRRYPDQPIETLDCYEAWPSLKAVYQETDLDDNWLQAWFTRGKIHIFSQAWEEEDEAGIVREHFNEICWPKIEEREHWLRALRAAKKMNGHKWAKSRRNPRDIRVWPCTNTCGALSHQQFLNKNAGDGDDDADDSDSDLSPDDYWIVDKYRGENGSVVSSPGSVVSSDLTSDEDDSDLIDDRLLDEVSTDNEDDLVVQSDDESLTMQGDAADEGRASCIELEDGEPNSEEDREAPHAARAKKRRRIVDSDDESAEKDVETAQQKRQKMRPGPAAPDSEDEEGEARSQVPDSDDKNEQPDVDDEDSVAGSEDDESEEDGEGDERSSSGYDSNRLLHDGNVESFLERLRREADANPDCSDSEASGSKEDDHEGDENDEDEDKEEEDEGSGEFFLGWEDDGYGHGFGGDSTSEAQEDSQFYELDD